jgi:hypothetical protein
MGFSPFSKVPIHSFHAGFRMSKFESEGGLKEI